MSVLGGKLSKFERCALVLSNLLLIRDREAGYPLVHGYNTPFASYETPATITVCIAGPIFQYSIPGISYIQYKANIGHVR